MHCKSLCIKVSAKCINVIVLYSRVHRFGVHLYLRFFSDWESSQVEGHYKEAENRNDSQRSAAAVKQRAELILMTWKKIPAAIWCFSFFYRNSDAKWEWTSRCPIWQTIMFSSGLETAWLEAADWTYEHRHKASFKAQILLYWWKMTQSECKTCVKWISPAMFRTALQVPTSALENAW